MAVVALVALVALTMVGVVALPPGAVSRPAAGRAAGLARLESLPLQAQSVISTSVGAGSPGFAAHRSGNGYRGGGGGVAGRFSVRDAVLRGGAGSLAFASAAVGRAGRLDRLGVVAVTAHGNRVVYDRGLLREWYAAGPLGIEQGFIVARRPGADVGAWAWWSLRAVKSGSGVVFVTRSGRVALRYGGPSATDAGGRRLPAALLVRAGKLVLGVSDVHAVYPLRIDPLVEVGSKLAPGDESGTAYFGWDVARSADATTALIGGPRDDSGNVANGDVGAAWVFTGSGSSWTEQARPTAPATGRGAESGLGGSFFSQSVALSSDGNTALIGGPGDNADLGATWVYTRSGSSWTEQAKLLAPTTGPDAESGPGQFGNSVALSSAGTTVLIGGNADSSNGGAAWVFTGSGTSWTERAKLTAPTTGSDAESGAGIFGASVAYSANGPTALIGGYGDSSNVGAAWVFTQSGFNSAWVEQVKLIAPTAADDPADAETGAGIFGDSMALSADATRSLIAGETDNGNVGAAWTWAPPPDSSTGR